MLNFQKPQTTRIAPSPTGHSHLGLVRTMYLNWLAARSTGGKFILRIDDTDPARSKQEYEDHIISTFEWLGIEWDEMFHQSERYDLYKSVADKMVVAGLARHDDGAIRGTQNLIGPRSWKDIIAGEVPITEKDNMITENLVLMRTDGSPTYHFASCVDDIDMGISLIIRGTDHISNASSHACLFNAISHVMGKGGTPTMAHAGLIFHNGKKLSKRDDVANIQAYRDGNYHPSAILNAVIKLGWGHPNPKLDKEYPLIDKETALKLFPEGKLKSSQAGFDLNKLESLNKKYNALGK